MTRRVRPVLLLLLLAAPPLHGQVLSDHTFGGLLGVSLAKAVGSDAVGSKVVPGVTVGGFLTLGFSKAIAVEPQALMIEKGLKNETDGLKATVKLTYIQVPLLVKLRVPLGSSQRLSGFLFGGPALGVRVGCRRSLEQDGNSINSGCDDSAEDVRTLDAGVVFGLGADFGRATVSVRYDMGLSKLDKSSEANDIKNSAILLLLGVKVRLNPE